jgi:putative redox protein
MIQSVSLTTPQQASFTNGEHSGVADVPREKGGDGNGFGPHELIEAALATCMTITIQQVAAKRGLNVGNAQCEVRIDRSQPDRVILNYALNFDASLSDCEARELREAASRCPVARTLSGDIAIEPAL